MWEYPSLSDRTPLPWFFISFFHITVILGVTLPPTQITTRGYLSLTILICLCCKLATSYTAGSSLANYSIGTAVAQIVVRWVDFGVLSRPEIDFKSSRERNDEVECPSSSKEKKKNVLVLWLRKLEWSARLMTTARGIGWSWQVKNIPLQVSEAKSTRSFIRLHLLRIVYFYLVADICETMLGIFAPAASQILWAPRLENYAAVSRHVLPWVWAFQMYASVNMSYSLGAAVTNMCGICSPEDWPPMFGLFRDAYTVRRFWGTTWHQCFRRTVTTFGRLFSHDILGFQTGSFGSKYTQLYVGFLTSALPHCFGAFLFARQECGEIRFFIGQAMAITLEDAFIANTRSSTTWPSKLMGYVWVFSWLHYSLGRWALTMAHAGSLAERSLPFSVVQLVVNRV